MSLIKFPSAVKPDRITSKLLRSDEMFQSQATGIQQTSARGNAYWQHTIEYRDLSMSERDIVQAFLLKCRGSANSFMLPDFGAYELPSGISSAFTDVLSNTGYVWSTAGSSDQYINSEYLASSAIDRHVTADNELLCSWRRYYSVFGIRRWPLANNALGINTHTAYIQRIKFTQNPEGRATQVLLAVGSGNSYFLQRGYCGNAYPTSSGVLSMPFITGNEITSYQVGVVFTTGGDGRQNMKWRVYDYHISRCALVANSENLLKSSSIFDTDWTATRASVTSGYDAGDPVFGIRSGAWALFGNSDVNTTHYAAQGVTKPTTEDLYTFSIYAKAKERTEIKMLLQTPNNNYNQAVFWLASGTAQLLNDQGNASRGSAKIYDISSGWYRCAITGLTTSHSTVTGVIYPTSGTGTQYTNNGSDGVLIYGGQLNRHPFVTPHVPTSDTVVVGSGNWQSGNQLWVTGMDGDTVIQAGTRFEVITQYHNDQSNNYEKSEFKRLSHETLVNPDGTARLRFDPPLRNSPVNERSDKAGTHLGETVHNAVIFAHPEIKSRLINSTVEFTEKPLKMTDVVFDVIEDLSE